MHQLLAQADTVGIEGWNLVTQVGLSVALVIFFVVRDSKRQQTDSQENKEREKALNARIESLEAFHREVLLSLNTKCTESLSHSTLALDRCAVALENNTRALEVLRERRP